MCPRADRFAHEDILLNETYSTRIPNKFRAAGSLTGEPMNLEILDDYTFQITFAEQYGGFLWEEGPGTAALQRISGDVPLDECNRR